MKCRMGILTFEIGSRKALASTSEVMKKPTSRSVVKWAHSYFNQTAQTPQKRKHEKENFYIQLVLISKAKKHFLPAFKAEQMKIAVKTTKAIRFLTTRGKSNPMK